MLHKRTDREPETVAERELVTDDGRICNAGIRIVPLVGREAAHQEHRQRDQGVSHKNVEPNIQRERFHEREETRRWLVRHL